MLAAIAHPRWPGLGLESWGLAGEGKGLSESSSSTNSTGSRFSRLLLRRSCEIPPALPRTGGCSPASGRVPWICTEPCSWEPAPSQLAAAQPPKGPQGRYYPGSPRGRGWPWQLEVLRIKPSELPASGACAQTGEQLPKLQVPGEPQCFDTWTSTTAPQSGMGKSCQVPAPCQEFHWFCSHVLPCISCVQLLTQGCSGKVQS